MAEGVLSEDQAQSALDAIASRNSKRSHSTEHHHTEPHPTPQSSLHKISDEGSGKESSNTGIDEDILSYEDMILNDRRYLCSIPRVPEPETSLNGTHPTPEDEEKELARATNRGWELLKSMDGNCLYFYSGWWSYSFCYGQAVRQFHQLPPGKGIPIYPPVEDKGVEAYVLGRFDDPEGGKSKSLDSTSATGAATETGLAKMETKGDVRYMVQHLGGGTTCDLTGRERRIEVQVCNVDNVLRAFTNTQVVPMPAKSSRQDCLDQGDYNVCLPYGHRYATPLQRRRLSSASRD
jgi:protein OS-9